MTQYISYILFILYWVGTKVRSVFSVF